MASPHRAIITAAAAAVCAALLGSLPSRAEPATRPATQPAATTRPAATTQPAADADKAAKEKAEEDKKAKANDAWRQSQRQSREFTKNQYKDAKDLPTFKVNDLLQMSIEDGKLRIDGASAAAAPQQQMKMKVEGSTAVYVVTRSPAPTVVGFRAVNPGPSLSVQRIDPSVTDDDTPWSVHLSTNNLYLTLMSQSVSGRVTYSQSGGKVHLNVMEWQVGGPGPRANNVFTAQATSFQQMRTEHPDEFRKFLVPLLAGFSDLGWMKPGPSDVYGVFPEVQADQQVTHKIEALLPELDSPSSLIRDAASQRLMTLGPAGVLAALRLDPATLTDEQGGRLGELVARHRRRDVGDPAAARKDPYFLADCLEYDDPAVRRAAKDTLERVIGQPVKVDIALSGDVLSKAVDGVRKQIADLPPPATQPSTQPATRPAGAAAAAVAPAAVGAAPVQVQVIIGPVQVRPAPPGAVRD